MKPTYNIYIEGALYESGLTKAKAIKMRTKFESEGWTVVVLKIVQTVLGPMGVSI